MRAKEGNSNSEVFPVITAEKLRIYQRYNGDIDGFARGHTTAEFNSITDDDWRDIDVLWQRLALEHRVPCAESFRAETQRLLSEQVADAATVAQFKQVAV